MPPNRRVPSPLSASPPTLNKPLLGPLYVNGSIEQKMQSIGGDADFQHWWPPEFTDLGEYYNGAGGMRLKGKFAYYHDPLVP
jgi:hypothetical protein